MAEAKPTNSTRHRASPGDQRTNDSALRRFAPFCDVLHTVFICKAPPEPRFRNFSFGNLRSSASSADYPNVPGERNRFQPVPTRSKEFSLRTRFPSSLKPAASRAQLLAPQRAFKKFNLQHSRHRRFLPPDPSAPGPLDPDQSWRFGFAPALKPQACDRPAMLCLQ